MKVYTDHRIEFPSTQKRKTETQNIKRIDSPTEKKHKDCQHGQKTNWKKRK